MPNNYFKFKQFTIIQEKAAMKVGTDGVLLGAWTNCAKTKHALDIGTGTGLIALMLAQRCNAIIDAIDIEKSAVDEATQNANNSPWVSRINIFHTSIQEYSKQKNKYDLIVSNPPFFNNSLKAENTERTTARHTDTLNANDLFKGVAELLNNKGKFCLIIPANNLQLYQETAEYYSIFCNKILWVKPTPNKTAIRVLLEFSFKQKQLINKTLIVEKYGRHIYSEEYIELTKDFYLKF